MSYKVKKEDCINLGKALSLEWLDTNGIGGYASSTILCCHTRKYHGLLTAQLEEPAGKFVLLSKLDDSLFLEDKEEFLSVHRYEGAVFPKGHRYLSEFSLGIVPKFKYFVGGTHVQKEIAMLSGSNTTLINYQAKKNRADVKLRIKPLLACRDFHSVMKENIYLRVRTFPVKNGFLISPYDGMPNIYVKMSGAFEFYPAPMWYRNFVYIEEARRGFDPKEDLFCPGVIEMNLPEGEAIIFSASTDDITENLQDLWNEEMERRNAVLRKRIPSSQLNLSLSANQFIVSDKKGKKSITAGYHWFVDWGRDAMIALPGLTLARGENELCKEVLLTFASHEKDGLIPNFIGSTPESNAYNSADASLWFGWAVQQYASALGGPSFLDRKIVEVLVRVFESYVEGTRFGISMIDNGLVSAGSDELQITWMDAAVDGIPVTPRSGCAVEINALWFNLVCFIAELGDSIVGKAALRARELVEVVRKSYLDVFWIEEEQRLADVVREGSKDVSMRPNQIFAASLPYSPLTKDMARTMLARVKKELLTPFGLRTLSPADSRYQGQYFGGPKDRDRAYHNGTVWPWLLCHYGEARLKTTTDKEREVSELEQILTNFEKHVEECGMGSISEVFDGDPPHRPNGCISQAWSVAEIIRLSKLVEKEKRQIAKRN